MERLAKRLRAVVDDAVVTLYRQYRPDIAMLRAILNPTARPLFSRRFGANGNAMLERVWKRAGERWATLPRQSGLGAAITVRLAAITAAAYETFVAEGADREEATIAVYDIAWAVYRKMGGVAWALGAIAGKRNADRMGFATVAFRMFPFSPPSYEWKDIPSPQGASDSTASSVPLPTTLRRSSSPSSAYGRGARLIFPLARDVWHARLERSGSIAGGQSHCDFRWNAEPDVVPADMP